MITVYYITTRPCAQPPREKFFGGTPTFFRRKWGKELHFAFLKESSAKNFNKGLLKSKTATPCRFAVSKTRLYRSALLLVYDLVARSRDWFHPIQTDCAGPAVRRADFSARTPFGLFRAAQGSESSRVAYRVALTAQHIARASVSARPHKIG
ncbi:MAG: hypothetical protein J6P88_03545 [Clostridia bacterium]|nr:hypothetical protein [Clostridia bacterium]